MWTELLNYDPLEPAELRYLKQKLANLSRKNCKCLSKSRERYADPISNFVPYNPNEKHVQVEEQPTNFEDYTQTDPDLLSKVEYVDTFAKDVLCPGCFVTMNLLRREVLVLKDEESETKSEMFRCDKSTEKSVKVIEKTTSVTKHSAKSLQKFFSNLIISDSSFSVSYPSFKQDEKRSLQVKFDSSILKNPSIKQNISNSVTCLCMENFVNAIRPPLDEYFLY